MIKALFLYPFSKTARFCWHYLVALEYTNFLNEALLNKESILQSEQFKKFVNPPDEKLLRFLPPDELDPKVREQKTFNRIYVDRRKSTIEKNLAKMKEIDPNSPLIFEIESLYLQVPKKEVPDTPISTQIKSHYQYKRIIS
jgi:hypothetical protein